MLTRAAAPAGGAAVLQASALSRDHHVCAAEPWATGISPRADTPASAPIQPYRTGMEEVAAALQAMLSGALRP